MVLTQFGITPKGVRSDNGKYDRLRVMGCLCFGMALRKGSEKFDPKGRKSILLECPTQQRWYMLYDLTTKVVYHCRHVIFQDLFSFKDGVLQTPSSNTDESDLLSIIAVDQDLEEEILNFPSSPDCQDSEMSPAPKSPHST
ncbi:hypothetical protein V2J09_009542 [Rumex salicifolius]